MESCWAKLELLYINGETLMKIGMYSREKTGPLHFIEVILYRVMCFIIYFPIKDYHIYRGAGRQNSESTFPTPWVL